MATATESKPRKARSSKGKGKTTDAIYAEVTDRIIASMEEGHIPWHRPWKVRGGVHENATSQKAYRGINRFLLDLTAMENGYTEPYWMTYKQAQGLGAHVRKDEKSTIVVFWKLLKFKEEDDAGEDHIKTIPLLRYYRVFNIEQIAIDPKGNWKEIWKLADKMPEIEEDREVSIIEQAQAIIDEMPNAPEIKYGDNRAFYRPSEDFIGMPDQESFDTDEHFYHTAYHEMVHSTGHESRLHRVKDWQYFGTDPYAKEELVAEMGAAMLAGVAGIDVPATQENTKAYIKSWIKRFKEDKKLLVSAGAQAQKASDYILGVTYESKED